MTRWCHFKYYAPKSVKFLQKKQILEPWTIYICITYISSYMYTCVICLRVLPVYLCYLSTCVTCLPVTFLHVLPVYLCYLYTCVTCLHVLPVYACYLSTCVTCLRVLPVCLVLQRLQETRGRWRLVDGRVAADWHCTLSMTTLSCPCLLNGRITIFMVLYYIKYICFKLYLVYIWLCCQCFYNEEVNISHKW